MQSDDTPDLWSLIFYTGKNKLTSRTGSEGLQGVHQRRSCYLTLWKTMVIRCGQKEQELLCMLGYNGWQLHYAWIFGAGRLQEFRSQEEDTCYRGNSALHNAVTTISRLKNKGLLGT